MQIIHWYESDELLYGGNVIGTVMLSLLVYFLS